LPDGNNHMRGMAAAAPGEAQDFISDVELGDVVSAGDDDACQVAALA